MADVSLAVIALLAAVPATGCVRWMIKNMPRWMAQAYDPSSLGLEAGRTLPTQTRPLSGPPPSGGLPGISRKWDGFVFVGFVILFVLIVDRWAASTQTVAAMILVIFLVALALIDFRTGLLPDVLTKSGLALGLVINAGSVWTSWGAAIMGALAGYWLLWLFYHLYRLATGKEGMGYGDFKLFAMLGAWFGWESLAPILLTASLLAMVLAVIGMTMKRLTLQASLPFGPFMAFGGILRLFEWI